MDRFTIRCPRCKQVFTSGDAGELADTVVAHVEHEHGHAPPREHVVARIKPRDSSA